MLSVIVPIYNAEKYLTSCLNSILRQDCGEMEIICVNDGSTDSSLDILAEYSKLYKEIVIYNKKNTGYGDSMNQGIRLAKGDRIGIVESDDCLAEGAYRRLLDLAERFDADVVKGNYFLFSDSAGTRLYDNLEEVDAEKLLDRKEINKLFFTAPSIWSGVYRKRFLTDNEIWFSPTPGAAYQDTAFAFKVWANAKRVVTCKEGIICDRIDNPDSSSSNESTKVFEIQYEFEEIEKTIRALGRDDLWPIFTKVKYISYIWNMNRLQPEMKILFLDGIHSELQMMKENGWLKQELWSESDWAVMHRLIDNFEKYKTDLLDGKAFWEAGI